MAKNFIKLNIGDTVASGSGREWKKLSDPLAGTWMFNDTINLPTNIDSDTEIYCRFYSLDDVNLIYSYIRFSYPPLISPEKKKALIYQYNVSNTTHYPTAYDIDNNTWVKSGYRTITILDNLRNVHKGEELLAWLVAHATKIA